MSGMLTTSNSVVSIALGRPFAINEDDIDVTVRKALSRDSCGSIFCPSTDSSFKPFAVGDDGSVGAQSDLRENIFKPSMMAVPLHILELRQIASNITTSVYSHRKSAGLSAEQREEVSNSLHQRLLSWRRNMPFPLPNTDAAVPHLNSSWYDFNYYLHLAMLYRPSPLFPTLTESRVKLLAEAASMSIRQVSNMHRQDCLAYNWLNLLSIFTATLSLIYATTVQPDNLTSVLRDKRAVADLDLTIELFDKLSVKFPVAGKIRRMVEQISTRYKEMMEVNEA